MTEPTTYDHVAWHLEEDALPEGLPETAASLPIGFFWHWAVANNLYSPEYVKTAGDAVLNTAQQDAPSAVAARLDGVLDSTMFNAQGNAFAEAYYDQYLDDLDTLAMDAFQDEEVTLYELPDDWQVYEAIQLILDARYADWQDNPDQPFDPLDLTDEDEESQDRQ